MKSGDRASVELGARTYLYLRSASRPGNENPISVESGSVLGDAMRVKKGRCRRLPTRAKIKSFRKYLGNGHDIRGLMIAISCTIHLVWFERKTPCTVSSQLDLKFAEFWIF